LRGGGKNYCKPKLKWKREGKMGKSERNRRKNGKGKEKGGKGKEKAGKRWFLAHRKI
jgi:hypothetical protein